WIRIVSVELALALRSVGRIWRRRWIPTFPSRFAPTGDAFIEVDRAIHSHDLRGAVRAALIDLHSDEGAPAAHGLRVVVRVFLRYPRVGQGADQAARHRSGARTTQHRHQRTSGDD